MADDVITDAGVVLEGSRDILRKGAVRVLTDFTMSVEGPGGQRYTKKDSVNVGDSIIFQEKIGFCPALVIATMLAVNLWFVMTTAECGPTKCDDHQAMKCARLNDQNLRIFRDFVEPSEDAHILTKWRSGLADGVGLERIIDRTTKRWTH